MGGLCNKAMKSELVDFDSIIIGSSPLFLLEAVVRAKCGERVLVVERRPYLGGGGQFPATLGMN